MRTPTVFVAAFLGAHSLVYPPATARPADQVGGAAAVQRPNSSGARLSGRVLAAETGKPLRNAMVTVAPTNQPGLPSRNRSGTSTDADGRWEIGNLTAGSYAVAVAKAGYITMSYGQRRPLDQSRQTIDLKDGQVLEKIDVSLPKGGVISGRILDEFGEPINGAIVSAMRFVYVEGERQLVSIGAEGIAGLLSGGLVDDLGQYRLYGLPAGDYYVSVSAADDFGSTGRAGGRTAYAPTLYPGTASATDAQRVTVAAGQEAQNITFNLTRIPVATISGKALDSFGKPIARGLVVLTTAVARTRTLDKQANTTPDGSFTILNVPPGDYRLHVQTPLGRVGGAGPGAGAPPPETEIGSLPITVAGQDISGISLATAPGVTASGRVVLEGGGTPQVNSFWMWAPAVTPGAISTGVIRNPPVQADGRFELRGLLDRHLIRVRAQGAKPLTEWFLKSVTVGGKDVTQSGYEFVAGQNVTDIVVVMTQSVTTLSGSVLDARDCPIADCAVVAFSTDPQKWGYESSFVRSVTPDQDGKFVLRGLPPGDYFVLALPHLEPGEEAEPLQLEKWKSRATRISLAGPEEKSLTLRLIR